MIRHVVRLLIRFGILWALDAVSIGFTAWLLPGINLVPADGNIAVTAAAAAFMLGIVNLLIRPLILLLALPLGFFVIFAIGFIANALTLMITSALLPAFQVQGFGSAFLGGLVMALINTIVVSVIEVDDDDSFFQGLVERVASRQKGQPAIEQTRGLVMLEIDGLSYYHMMQALESGKMPEANKLIEEEGYKLSRVDCGIPSQTSACQAGILFGDNYDIPAFRWYDKELGRAFVSGKDAGEINARYAKGSGLLRGGSSVNNMMNGDAAKSLLTLADLKTGTPEEKKRRAGDIYLMMINPYFIMRTIILVIGDALLEVWQYWQDKRKDVQPRLNRLHHGYPLVRAACTVFMRDVAEYLVSLDIVRGVPAIYATWPGYDEVAHHTGPSTEAAFHILAKYDKTIGRVWDVIQRKGPRPYDFVVLSDHGQSFGATFSQRYGYSLKEYIEKHLPAGSGVDQSTGGDDGTIALVAVSGELENMSEQGMGGSVGKSVAKRSRKAIEAGVEERQSAATITSSMPAAVTVFGSGNLAPVYFHFSKNRVTRPELEATYPGLFPALLEHEGIGVVVGYDADGTPMVWGKTGTVNLRTGAVDGENPLTIYGDPIVRAEQLCRLADFPHNGDLTVFSTVYPDGTVAAMEELIGSHGGMGGVQTDAFLFHAGDMPVPNTTNSADVFKILDGRRGTYVEPKVVKRDEVDEWTPAHIAKGIAQPSKWLPLAGSAVLLRSKAYRKVVADPLMTGPALLIGVVTPILAGLVTRGGLDLTLTYQTLFRWLLGTVIVFATGRVLRGGALSKHKVTYTEVFRAMGFAQAALILGFLGLVPVLSRFALILSSVVGFAAGWLAAVVAFELKGWRAIIFPLVMVIVFLVSIVTIGVLLRGAAFSLSTIAQQLGFAG